MYITEIFIPILKQDPQTKTAFLSTALPILTGLLKAAPGRITNFHGFIIEENDAIVEEQLKPFIGIGMWLLSRHAKAVRNAHIGLQNGIKNNPSTISPPAKHINLAQLSALS
jgi:hypothetical protein